MKKNIVCFAHNTIHSEKKGKDYLKGVIITHDNSAYTLFVSADDAPLDKVIEELETTPEVDIQKFRYDSALMITSTGNFVLSILL